MFTLIGFGASTVQGVGDPQGGFLARVAAQHTPLGSDVRIVNKGIGGETTREMLRRAAELGSLRPYSIVVQLGCNDFPRAHDQSPEKRTDKIEYTENVQKLLDAVCGDHSLFISSFLVSEELTGVSAATFDERIPAAMEAAKSSGYEVWNLYGETRDAVTEYLAADGLHFNAAGHEMMARRVLRWMEEIRFGETR